MDSIETSEKEAQPLSPADIKEAMHSAYAAERAAAANGAATEHTKPSNPKDAAATDRLDLSLFPDTAVAYGALAFTEGALKYGAYNWRVAGVSASVYVAALRRHVAKWYNGEKVDPKTGVPHLANALACIAILIDAHEVGKLIDDRPPRIPNPDVMFDELRFRVRYLQGKFPPEQSPDRFTER